MFMTTVILTGTVMLGSRLNWWRQRPDMLGKYLDIGMQVTDLGAQKFRFRGYDWGSPTATVRQRRIVGHRRDVTSTSVVILGSSGLQLCHGGLKLADNSLIMHPFAIAASF